MPSPRFECTLRKKIIRQTEARASCWWDIPDASDEREAKIIYDAEPECLTLAPLTHHRCVNVFVYNFRCFGLAFENWENVALHVALRNGVSRESFAFTLFRVAVKVWLCVYSVVSIQRPEKLQTLWRQSILYDATAVWPKMSTTKYIVRRHCCRWRLNLGRDVCG